MSYINPDLAKASISLAAGVFTVTMPSPCKVVLPSTTAGANVTVDISGNTYTFNDDSHASSNLTNLGFGITETADWAEDMPFFMYLVNEDNTGANVGCFISRLPNLSVTPAADYIHDKDAAAANDTQSSIFGMWSDDAGKAAKPVLLIGAFRMQWSTTTDDWTVQTLGNTDGIGQDRLDKTFATEWTFPAGQIHNQAGCLYNVADGSTNLDFDTQVGIYFINKDGSVDYLLNLSDCDANGDESEPIKFALPLSHNVESTAALGEVQQTNLVAASPIQAAYTTTNNVAVYCDDGDELNEDDFQVSSTVRLRMNITIKAS